MFELDGFQLEGTTRVPVAIDGEWSPAPDLSQPLLRTADGWVPAPNLVRSFQLIDGVVQEVPYVPPKPILLVDGEQIPTPCREWHALATAAEPIVGVSIVRTATECRWIRCNEKKTEQTLRVALVPCQSLGRHVSVQAHIGHQSTYAETVVASHLARPEIAAQQSLPSGTIHCIARCGEPELQVLFLFLARTDIQTGRNRTWSLRPKIAEKQPELLRKMLSLQRAGFSKF